ncbi:hypothetical protein C5Y96_14845 [Blastopirellula marina]|uniref:Uncharacterized protein n=1 Tax=Blastopirellula marina TaxID=124 RepID=A0A2S8FEZ1_9BACT|nr:hypothetical protein C5Y96_14845 [Blastopirellula marina]RCS50872.1 hypothetical protein DTL36_14855 [Bremerella cremea]
MIFKGPIPLVRSDFVLKDRILENLGKQGQGNLERFGALRFEEKGFAGRSGSSDRWKVFDRMNCLVPTYAIFPLFSAFHA